MSSLRFCPRSVGPKKATHSKARIVRTERNKLETAREQRATCASSRGTVREEKRGGGRSRILLPPPALGPRPLPGKACLRLRGLARVNGQAKAWRAKRADRHQPFSVPPGLLGPDNLP